MNWTQLPKVTGLIRGQLYLFSHISCDGGEFYEVREFTTHLSDDLRVLTSNGVPVVIPPLMRPLGLDGEDVPCEVRTK